MRVVICKKCGYLKGDYEDITNCPVCGSIVSETTLNFNSFSHMSKIQEDEYRFTIQPKEQYDQDLWQKRIEYDDNRSYQIHQQTARINAAHPECPYCHSRNTRKISTASKAINTGLFGIFGTKRHKEFHCDNCKSDF